VALRAEVMRMISTGSPARQQHCHLTHHAKALPAFLSIRNPIP
jgi:hypothetical protein